MAVARTRAIALLGLTGVVVEIEADLSSGLPAFALIGLPDAALSQARDRVRAAIGNSGAEFPGQRVTVNLSPAALPKQGAVFDLGVALAVLAAGGVVSPEAIDRVVHLGELGLDGRLRPTPGILPAILAARRAGHDTVMVPTANADEASLVGGVRVIPVASLRAALIRHGADLEDEPVEPVLAPPSPEVAGVGDLDLADVVGSVDAVEAMIVAAAGGHHTFLLGPPGAGKTMLAARLPGVLPELDPDEALEVASVRSLAGDPVGGWLSTRPPFESPHHTATAAALVGGGSAAIRPGAAARASHGVLFLDEAPEFRPSVLDALRQPLESGVITIHRASAVATFPGRFQLVLAANPCPCGQYGAPDSACTCPPQARRRYLGRLSGPLLDRIDIQLRVPRVTAAQVRMAGDVHAVTSEMARSRVLGARAVAAERWSDAGWRVNAHAPGPRLRAPGLRLAPGATSTIDRALERGTITMRGYDRVLRVRCKRKTHRIRNAMSDTRAAVYLRQSIDSAEGIERQRERTFAICSARGWTTVSEYVDNDTSATRTRAAGTAWSRLLEDARQGQIDVVVAVDLDRLLRSVSDLVDLTNTGAKVLTVDGEIDLTTADGEFRATMLAGIARFETRRKSERQVRANAHAAAQGRYRGGRRAFGYETDGITVRAEEARLVAAGFRDLLAGVPLAAIARTWNATGIPTPQPRTGAEHRGEPSQWQAYSVRSVLTNPRYMGARAYRGEIVAVAEWPAIVDESTWRAVNRILNDPSRRRAPTRGRYLLTGLALCGVCRGPVHAGGSARAGVPAYRCRGSRGHFARRSAPVDEYVEAVMVARLSRADARELIAPGTPDTGGVEEELLGVQARLDALAVEFADGGLTSSQLRIATERLLKRRSTLQGQIADSARGDLLGPLVSADDVGRVWRSLTRERKRAVIATLCTVVLMPPGRGVRSFSPDTVGLEWHRD